MNALLDNSVPNSPNPVGGNEAQQDVDDDYEKLGAKWFNMYFHFVERNGKYIFVFWLFILLLGFIFGPDFLKMGDDRAEAPKNSRAWYAEDEFHQRYADQARQVPMLILIRALPPADIGDSRLFDFAKALKNNVLRYNKSNENVLSMISYYDMKGTVLDGAKDAFVNKARTATFMNINVKGDQITNDRFEFVRFIKKEVDELNPNHKTFFIGVTGIDAMMFDSSDNTAKNLAKTDSFSIPIAMVLLGAMIHSWRLLLFSFLNMATGILSSFALMAFFVNYMGFPHPESASAQLMEVITLAVSIDWSLFLHRRYRDEIKQGCDNREAAYLSLMHSGHVVVMSGATLWVVFVGFLLLPAPSVNMDGLCCSMGVLLAMLVCLTNTPAVWLTFPNFCSDFDNRCCKNKTMDDLQDEAMRLGLVDSLESPLMGEIEAQPPSPVVHHHSHHKHHVMYNGPRFRFTRWITKFPNNILSILLVYILVIPFALQVKDIVLNQDFLSSMPRGSAAAQTYKQAFANFPGGTFAPFYVLVTSKHREDSHVVLESSFFDAARGAAQEILRVSKEHDSQFTSAGVMAPVLLNGMTISLREAKSLLETAKAHKCNVHDISFLDKPACSLAKQYEFAYLQSVNTEANAMLISITVPFFPFASQSTKYIDLLYTVLDKQSELHPEYDFYLSGVVVGFDALQRSVVALFPQLVATTFIIVFIILGLLLRSLFVPIRLALTLVAPLCAVFGSAVMVYQKGALEWTGFACFGKMDGFFWYVPILLLSMIIGLSLDWDVLLISRIMEHRENGYDCQASICKAVCETGGTISVAGVIMCLAFGGMLLSDQLMVNACGFILTVALLLDTFLVNTTLVPALISIGDRVAWYPTRMPMENLKTLENCSEFPRS